MLEGTLVIRRKGIDLFSFIFFTWNSLRIKLYVWVQAEMT